MSARGMSARGLRAFLLVAGILFGTTNASAETVQLTYQTVEGAVGGQAGLYKFKIDSTGSSLGAQNSFLYTFCISQSTFISNPNGLYTLTDAIQSLPTPGTAMGLLNSRKLAVLVNEVFRSGGTLASYNDNDTETGGWAAVQGAVWRIINPLSTLPGSVALSNDANALVTTVTNLLASFGNDLNLYYASISGQKYYIHGLDASAGNNQLGQDQIYWTTSPNFVIEAPVPTGVVMAGMGIVCLGGVNFLRRRKVVAAV
jgi:hypothetical protein